jgi:two-component system cell cycle sensor histidine kinase/response regulator CckA
MGRKSTYEELEQRIRELEKAQAEHQQKEKTLHEQVLNYKILMDTSLDGIAIIDQKHRVREANKRFAEMLGYTSEEVLGLHIWDWEAMMTEAEIRSDFADLAKTKATFETCHRRKDGTIYDAEVTACGVNLGDETMALTVTRDITERKRAEKALRESEERFRANFHYAPVGMAVIDTETKFLEVNRQICKILGYAPAELIGRSFNDFTHPEDRDGGRQHWEQLLDGKIKFNQAEKRYIHKSGKIVWSIVTNSLIRDEEGRPRYFVSHLLDISTQKQAQEDSERLEKQLQQAQKMEAVGRLAGGVAHDFNNMLSVIFGHTDIALADLDRSSQLYERLKEIRKAGERSADLTRQLLAFARKQTISPKIIDINKTVEGMTIMLQRLIGEDIDLNWRPAKNVWSVRMDPSQIDQILVNLCVNARDAITDVGEITIETDTAVFDEIYCSDHPGSNPGEHVLLSISDNGCGMDAGTLENIFDPFFTTKESGKGTGLGLATVYGVVKQNDGFVDVFSEPGQGTTFKIYLPRYRAKMESLPETAKDQASERGHETILLVEDEPAILSTTAQILARMGYQVVAARTPVEAIHLAQEHYGEIHLLLTDVVMPEMNGRDLAKNILATRPNLKRLFMSGYTANVIAHHGVLDDGVNFIQKPFSKEQLSAKVREALSFVDIAFCIDYTHKGKKNNHALKLDFG